MKKISWWFLFAISLSANPHDPSVIHGDVKFDGLGTSHITIETSDRSIIHWDGFSIGSEEITHFLQEHSDASVLNRVMGSEVSRIDGSLLSNGRVFLVNGNGIIIGKDAIIDVGSLIASSFDISNFAFIDQEDLLFDGESIESIENYGDIKASNYVLLFSHRIENSGSLHADHVFLGAGHRILVGVQGKQFLYVHPELPGDGILNSGEIQAIQTIIEANTSPFSLGVQNKGSIDAFSLTEESGEIFLRCKGSKVINHGSFSAKDQLELVVEDAFLENYHSLRGGEISIGSFGYSSRLCEQKPVSNYGTISGNSITLAAPKFENDGDLFAKKDISLFVPGKYLEMVSANLKSTHGNVTILAGNYFTSGTLVANSIDVEAESLLAAAAKFFTNEKDIGGKIQLRSNSYVTPMYLNEHVRISADGRQKGGNIILSSNLPIHSHAKISYNGKYPGSFSSTSTIDAPKKLSIVDPHPYEESILWSSIMQKEDTLFYAGTFWEIWDQHIRFELYDQSIQTTACPPTGIELEDPNPTGVSSSFGDVIQTLSTGNVVVTKPSDDFAAVNAGAVYLYNGVTGALISTLRGSSASDAIGTSITTLTNGNYIILSPFWNNGAISDAGAATLGNGSTGVSGTVSAANSLVGTTASSFVGSSATALTNGNYVIISPSWNDGVLTSLGAVTFGNGTTGIVGGVSPSNSLVGTQNSDQVGINGVTALTNGNYVVSSTIWDNGGVINTGAATFGSGTTGITGAVSTTNSLVGTTANDAIGTILALTNGNYVVRSVLWDNGGVSNVGAVTFGNGTTGVTGAVSSSNSLVGTQNNDEVGSDVVALTNGNYVVVSTRWNNGVLSDAGAVTFGNGTTGIAGTVSTVNSLVGSAANDQIGLAFAENVKALSNGNYVVGSLFWNGARGAVTFGNGTTGTTGVVSPANSLVGSAAVDAIGEVITVLTNGNYVVGSTFWNGSRGAATFGNGTTGTTGVVSTSNSLVGTQANDNVGSVIVALTNGNYIVSSEDWNQNRGAVTFGSGTTGITGDVSGNNSLIGSSVNDSIGNTDAVTLTNGNYVVISPFFNAFSGAITFGSGTVGITGEVSASNSIVGLGTGNVVNLSSQEFVIGSSSLNAVAIANAGTGLLCDGTRTISSANSFLGGSGLSTMTANNILNSGTDNNVLARFNNFGGETRVFTIAGTPTSSASSVTSLLGIENRGIHDYAVSIQEPYDNWGALRMRGILDARSIFGPQGTQNNLHLQLSNLNEEED